MKDQYYGIIGNNSDPRDYVLTNDILVPRAPKSTQSFDLNGQIQYSQNEISPVSCTLHGAIGAYSDLTGYKFTKEQRKEIYDEAITRGFDKKVGWYVNSAMKLIKDYVEKNDLPKVKFYKTKLGSFEFGALLRLGYRIVCSYGGNMTYTLDSKDGFLDKTSFGKPTYYHCLGITYSVGDEYERIVDNYPEKKMNIYKVKSSDWTTLVKNSVFNPTAYFYLLDL